jgi:hypothetical protein
LPSADQPVPELLGQAVAGRFGDPNHLDVGPTLERIGELVAGEMNSGHHGHIPPKQLQDRRTERSGGELHLAQLVHDHHPAEAGVTQGRQGDPLEGSQIHPIPAHPRRTRKTDVGQDLLGPGDGLDHEPLPAPAGPQLSRGEPADRHASLQQQGHQAPGHGGLADPRATLQQQPRGTLIHEANLADQDEGREATRLWSGAMARIDHYEFGQIIIDGRQETRDLIILPDRVVRNWWRHDGHALVADDLAEVLDELPAHLVVGTGADGRMRPDPDTIQQLQDRGVTVEALPTSQAVRRFGELDPAGTAAALHLTC